MTARRTLTPAPETPDLDRLLEAARKLPPMTAEQLRAQRISFAYGNAAIDNPNITRESVEKSHDEMYGKPERKIVRDPDLAAIHADLQRVYGILARIDDKLGKPVAQPQVRIARKWWEWWQR